MNDLFFFIPGCSCDTVPDQRRSFTLPGFLNLRSFCRFTVAAAKVEVGCFIQVKPQLFCEAVCSAVKRACRVVVTGMRRVCRAAEPRSVRAAGAFAMRL